VVNELGQKPNTSQRLSCILIFLVIGYWSSVHAQEAPSSQLESAVKEISNYAASLYGTDDVVVNGRKYFPEHYNAKGNPYFLSDKWTEASLFIDGKRYDNQEILYDIDIEKVILKTSIEDSLTIYLVLNNETIEAFYLGQRYFINAKLIKNEFPGFVELLYNGGFSVFSRHQKSFMSEYSRSAPNGFYSGTKSELYILYPGQLDKLPTKKSLLNYFSEYQKEIKTFMRKQKIKYKKADNIQLNKLFEYCDQLSEK
jgi:hypothetical protein